MSRMRESLRGTGKVFSFTFAQFWKNKANLVSLVILLVFSLLSVPVSTLAAGGSFSRNHAYGGEIALWDESGLSLDLADALAAYPDLAGASVRTVSGPTEGVCVHVSAGENGSPRRKRRTQGQIRPTQSPCPPPPGRAVFCDLAY